MKRLEKPVGVFAACDELAAELVEVCEELQVLVPGEVAVIGAGDSLLAVDCMNVPISSVDTNLELLGYRGAQELDRLMKGNPALAKPIRISAARVVARKSTDLLAVKHPGIARSLRFIQENFREPLRVSHLANVAAMSTRAFHLVFLNQVGRSPGLELQHARLEMARSLLRGSSEKLAVIALDCGYRNANSFSVAFKKATGLSPHAYRQQWLAPAARFRSRQSSDGSCQLEGMSSQVRQAGRGLNVGRGGHAVLGKEVPRF